MKGNLETSQPAVSSSIQQSARSYKDMLFQRIEQAQKKGKGNIQWIDYNFEILLTYIILKILTQLLVLFQQRRGNLKMKLGQHLT